MELNKVLEIVTEKAKKNMMRFKDFPHITKNGKWTTTKDEDWTGGFWIGLLWLFYKLTDDAKYKKEAYNWLKKLESRKKDRTFDLSFLFYPSFALGYKITNDEYLREVALEAADTLASLFNEKTGFVYNVITINGKKLGRTIIDVMMELPLLWWAYKETGNEEYHNVACTHSKHTIEEFIRDDYSTVHVIDFNLETGKTIRKITIQGYSTDSCWSRGQAWAIYGFTLAFKASKEKIFLKAAEKLAEYHVENLPEDFVPYYDFNDPEISNAVKDSSAAAIAFSGLLTLSEFRGEEDFREIAVNILKFLCNNYLCEEEKDGILNHGCYHKPENMGVNESLIWGDYYFVETLMKVREDMTEQYNKLCDAHEAVK